MITKAKLNSLRIAPRKVRLLARLMKGKDASVIKNQLRYWTKRSSMPLEKLLDSAIANARNNHSMVGENLRIKDVLVDGGTVLKRFRPKGFGSTSPIAKRTSNITIVLEEIVAGLKAAPRAVKEPEYKHEHKEIAELKPEVKKEIGTGRVKAFVKRVFNRKSI